jgi:NTE family protein
MDTRAAFVCVCLSLAPALAAARPAECPDARATTESPRAPIAANGMRIGLALGSGSMHGLAHIGVIEELEARGLDVDVVAGTSVGALIGGLWASGMSGREIETLARDEPWDELGGASWRGLLGQSDIRARLTPLFAGRPIETWPRRFGAVATDLANGHRRILMSGDGALAVQASSAMPVMHPPVAIGGARLADGALVEPVPIDTARALGADYVIAVDVAYRPYEEMVDGRLQYAFQSMHILTNALAAAQSRDADIVLRLDVHELLTACGAASVIAAGRQAVQRAWPEIARSLQTRLAARKARQGASP